MMMSEKYHIERYRPIYNVRHDDTQESIFNVVLSTLHINVVAELLSRFDFVRILQHFQIHELIGHHMLYVDNNLHLF